MPDLLSLAGTLEKPSDMTKLLQYLAEKAGADGAVYWRLAPGSVLNEEQHSGRFFPVASWLRFDDIFPWYYLPVNSITGAAWLERERNPFRLVSSIAEEQTMAPEAREVLIDRWHMTSCASVPISAADTIPGAVTFYGRKPIDLKDLKSTVPFVQQLPPLYALVGDRQALKFLTDLNEVLHGPSVDEFGKHTARVAAARRRLGKVCDLLAQHFDAIETSVLLTESPATAGHFTVQARRWGWAKEPYADVYFPGQGLTGWVLKHRAPLRILDLARFDEDRNWIENEYDQLEWRNLLDIRQLLRLRFALPEDMPDRDLPPVSFVCVPIIHGHFFGVVRCCGREKGPWSFEEVDQRVLQLAASFIGDWWEDLLEYEDVQRLVSSVTQLHKKAAEILVNERKDVEVLLKMTLTKAMEGIAAVDHGSVRLVDEEQNDLYYKVWEGELWQKGSRKESSQRTLRRFPLSPNSSAGAYVVNFNDAHIVNDIENDPFEAPVLNEVLRRVYVPIRGGGKVLGVLDLGRTRALDFTQRDAAVAENFAAQMGLYLYLDKQFEGRLAAQKKLRDEQEAQLRTFENLRHQVYGPAGTAAMALERICQMPSLPSDLREGLARARGDALRASIMVRSLDLFAALASDKVPRVKEERLTAVWLKHRLEELAAHQSYLAAPGQRLSFAVIDKGMDSLSYNPVVCDLNLLEHAVSNLIENARKYSGKGSKVQVQCGFMDHDRMCYISVYNSGLRIESNDIPKMITRGWRSDMAWRVVAEGTGIGLYVVDAIMRAHRGKLQIMPTNSNNINEVRLILPAGIGLI